MKFLGGLLGGKGSGKELVDKLVGELEGAGVTDSTWAACESSDALEDAIEDDLPRERLVPVLERCPRNAFNFCARCVAAAEAALALQGDAFDEGAEGRLVNSCLLLAKILSASPAGSRTVGTKGPQEHRAGGATEFCGFLWQAPPGERMLGQRALDMTLRALFHEGFTVDELDEEMRKANSDGVTPALIWADGVGPERESIPKPDKETRSNRQLVLQLLAALLVGGAPAAAAERQAAAEAAEGEAATGAEVAGRRLLVGDPRPLAYLCDPGEPVPLRGELLYSLLSTAFGYDPHGFGVPYAGYIMDSKDEEFAATCLQVLGVLLQDTADAEVPMKSAVAERRPQEEVRAALERARVGEGAQDRAGAGAGAAAPAGGGHVFRDLLRAISSESEVNFLVNGVMTLIGTISEERSTYLPSSMRLPPFLPEVMLIVFHLATCEAFVACACAQGEAPALVEGLLHVASRVPEHLSEETVAMLVGLVVLRLTAYREVCVALSEDFSGDVPDDLPDFQGSGTDLVALAALKQASDSLAGSSDREVHGCLVEVSLCIFANVSAFAEGFCMETCFRMFALLERCIKSAHVKRERKQGAIWLPRLLEACENAVQYQYASNANLVYGLMMRQGMLKELAALVAELVRLSEGSADDAASSPSISAEGSGPDLAAWWRDVAMQLSPLLEMLERVVPGVEAEVEKRDTTTPDEVKALLPRSVLGLLPAPRPFVLRTLRGSEFAHLACEHCLVGCLAEGPLGDLWEEEDAEGAPTKPAAKPKKAKPAKADKSATTSQDRGGSAGASSRSRAQASPESAGGRRTRRASPPDDAKGGSSSAGAAAAPATLQQQLEAAAAAGVDVAALMKQLQAQATRV